MRACREGDYKIVKSILDVEPAHVYDQDEYGQTALHVSVICSICPFAWI